MLCWTETADNSPEVDCGTLRAADMAEDVTSQREDVAATASICDVSRVDDVTREVANQTAATVDTCRLSPAPAVETQSTGRPSRLKKFIDRRTETLISACATVSTAEADVTRDASDVINEELTSPVPQSPKYRDRRFDVSSAHDRRQLGVVKDARPHRSTLTSVPATTTTTNTTTSVDALRSPVSLLVLRSQGPPTDATAATVTVARSPIVSPTDPVLSPSCSAESRLTVTLAESTWQQPQRNCRLISRTAAKPRDVAESGSGSADDVAVGPAAGVLAQSAVTSHLPRRRSTSSTDGGDDVQMSKSQRPSSALCGVAQLSPVTVQPSAGSGRTTSSHGRVPVTTTADTTSTSLVISRRAVIDLVSPPPLPPSQTVVSELSLPVRATSSSASMTSRQPATAVSPSRCELGSAAAVKTPAVTQSTMSALDNAMAMLTSVVSENCQPPQAASSAALHVITSQHCVGQSVQCGGRSKSSSEWDLLVYFCLLIHNTPSDVLSRDLFESK